MDLEEWTDLDLLSSNSANAVTQMHMCVFLKFFDQCLDNAALLDLAVIVASHKAWGAGSKRILQAMFLEAFGEVPNIRSVLSH